MLLRFGRRFLTALNQKSKSKQIPVGFSAEQNVSGTRELQTKCSEHFLEKQVSHEVKFKGRSFDTGLAGNLLQRCSLHIWEVGTGRRSPVCLHSGSEVLLRDPSLRRWK